MTGVAFTPRSWLGEGRAMTGVAFKNTHLSVSRLKLYERCALAFYFQYVEKGWKEPFGMAGVFGVVLHEALENTFRWILAEEFVGVFPVERLITEYQLAWQNNKQIDGVELYREGLQIVRQYAERHPMVDHMSILAVEQEFNLPIGGGFILNGYIDRVEKMGDDGVLIVDYKSSRNLYSKSELETDLQAATYLFVARTLYPWAKRFAFAMDMLRFNTRQAGPVHSNQDVEDTRSYLVTLGKKTESDTEWLPRLNDLCGWCDHRGRCPAYKEAVVQERPLTRANSLEGIEEIAAEREAVARLAKMMYGRKETLDKLIKAKLTQDGEFVAAGTRYKLTNAFKTSYPNADKVVEAFGYIGIPESEVRSKIYGVDSAAVKELAEEVTKRVDRSKALILEATLRAVSVQKADSPRLDARAEKKGGGAAQAKQKAADLAKEGGELAVLADAVVSSRRDRKGEPIVVVEEKQAPTNARIAALELDESVFE